MILSANLNDTPRKPIGKSCTSSNSITATLPGVEQHGETVSATAGLLNADGFDEDALAVACACLQAAVEQCVFETRGFDSQQLAAPLQGPFTH